MGEVLYRHFNAATPQSADVSAYRACKDGMRDGVKGRRETEMER